MAEVNYDVNKAKTGLLKYLNDFQPDMAYSYSVPFCGQMPMLDKLGLKWLQWAGRKGSQVDDKSIIQYIEKPYLEEDEYGELLGDISGWMLRRYLPRTTTTFEPFIKLDFRNMFGYSLMPSTLQFADPKLAESLKTMAEVAQDFADYYSVSARFERQLEEMGFVQQIAATTTVAFDTLSDTLRGTLGTMMDIMTQPENVKRAIELFFPGTLFGALAQAEHSNGRFIFIPLHKGMDTFLSGDQYKTFYWDTLLRLVNGLIEHGLTPWVYTEGPYNSRIECLQDLPKGKCWVHFETADMKKAKKILGNVACLSGGIGARMLVSGTKEEVIAKTKENIDILAPGGGYIFDLSDTMEDCRPELVEAMFETVRTYGKY